MNQNQVITLCVVCALVGGVSGIATQSFLSKPVGYINEAQIIKDHPQSIVLQRKQKEAMKELKALSKDVKKQLSEAKSVQEQKELQKTLTQKFTKRQKELEQDYQNTLVSLKNDLQAAVKDVALQKHLSVVLSQSNIVSGGVDVTQDVLNKLSNGKEVSSEQIKIKLIEEHQQQNKDVEKNK